MRLRSVSLIMVLLIISATIAWGDDYLLEKAIKYERVHQKWSSPGLGGVIQLLFTEPGSEEIAYLSNQGDSCEHTGLHLAAMALRYAVTRDPEALAAVKKDVNALHVFYRITGQPGFIARYAARDEWPFNIGHPNDRTVYGAGEYEGYFYINNTSRDMYCGWFFGMSLAHELVDDPEIRTTIEDDMSIIIPALEDQGWYIINNDGQPTNAAPNILKYMAAGWALQAAVATGDPELEAVYERIVGRALEKLPFESFSFFSKYSSYYGFSLSHQVYFGLLRHVGDPVLLEEFRRAFRDNIHKQVADTHNAFFDLVYLTSFDQPEDAPDYQALAEDIVRSVTDFPEPPLYKIPKELPQLPIDPFSELLVALQEQLGIDLGWELQSKEPQQIRDRCHKNFLWHSSPYVLECEANPALLLPGHDYLIAYWLGRYLGVVPPGNPNGDDDDDVGDDDFSDDDLPEENPDPDQPRDADADDDQERDSSACG